MMKTDTTSARATSKKSSRITLANNQGISVVNKLRDRLIKCVAKDTDVNLYASKVETIDTASLQLLLAFVREIKNKGHSVKWHSPSEPLINTASLTGMETELLLPTATG
jgi:ABC-type transporter Mla MlaB component